MPATEQASPFIQKNKKNQRKQPISLDTRIKSFYIWVVRLKDPTNKTTGVVAQFWLEHRPVTPEVASSSLVYPATKTSRKRGLFVY